MGIRETAFSFHCFSGGSPPSKWKQLCWIMTLLVVSTAEASLCLHCNYGQRLGSLQTTPGVFYFLGYLFVVNPGFS